MLTLWNLSNELLDSIIQAVPRDDLISLALTNKALYALTEKALKRHHSLKKYYVLNFCDCNRFYAAKGSSHSEAHDDRRDDTRDARLLLSSIFADSDIADYPQKLYLGYAKNHSPADNALDALTRSKRTSMISKHSEKLRAMIEECEYISSGEKENQYDLICQPDNEDVAIFLVLTALSNLSSFITEDYTHGYGNGWFQSLVRRVGIASQDSATPRQGLPLSQLREFSMGGSEARFRDDINAYGLGQESLAKTLPGL